MGPWGYTDYGVYSLFKQIPAFYLDEDQRVAGQPFKKFLLAMATMLRSEKEFSDRFPLLQDALAIRPQLLGLLGANVGAFVQVEDADIVKRNMALHAHTWFSTKGLPSAYKTIARMQGLEAVVDEVYEVPCGSGNFVIVPPHEFQFAPGIDPNGPPTLPGVIFPQDPVPALPGVPGIPPTFFPLPGDDILDLFGGGPAPPNPALWIPHTSGAGTIALNATGQLVATVAAPAEAAFVQLIDEYDRRAKFDTIVELSTLPGVGQVDPDTAFILAVLQPAVGATIGPKAKALAIAERRVTAEADRPNGVIYLRVKTNLGVNGAAKDFFWNQAAQAWVDGQVGFGPFSPADAPYRLTLRSHSQWFMWIVERFDAGIPGFVPIAVTKPFFWHDVLNNGEPMSVVLGETSNTTASLPTMAWDRFETAQTEDCDYAKVSCLQVQFFIPAPGSGAGTYFPPFGVSLDASALGVILANIRRKFEKVTPIHIRIKYPTQLLSAPARFFQHFDVNDLALTSPLTAADLTANPNVDAAFTSADSHPMDATPTMPFTKPPWVGGFGVADVYKDGQDGGWVEAEEMLPTATDPINAVLTEIGKRRMAELMGGIADPSSGAQPVRPTHFIVGTGGQASGRQKPPDSLRVDLEAPVAGRLLKNLVGPVAVGNDINVALPPFVGEPTVEFKLALTAFENNLGAGVTVAEVGVFVQFGGNPPELFAYGTFPPFLSDGTLAVDLRLRAKI